MNAGATEHIPTRLVGIHQPSEVEPPVARGSLEVSAGAVHNPQPVPAEVHMNAGDRDVTLVTCPSCRGIGSSLVEGNTRPAMASVCPTCHGARTIEVYWASSRAEPHQTHLVRWGTDPVDMLCPHIPVAFDEITRPSGAPCLVCITRLGDLAPGHGERWALENP